MERHCWPALTLFFRLDRIQKKSSLLSSLGDRRKDEMRRLMEDKDRILAGLNDFKEDDQEIADNPILRRLAPERVALTQEEKEALVKRDQLAENEEEKDADKDDVTPE